MMAFEENIIVCSCREDMLRTRTKIGEQEQQSCREARGQLGKLFTWKADSDGEGIGSWDLGQRYLDAPRIPEPHDALKTLSLNKCFHSSNWRTTVSSGCRLQKPQLEPMLCKIILACQDGLPS